MAEKIAHWIHQEERPLLKPVINATGILLHTGLGRAPLPEDAIRDMVAISSGYATVEVDPDSGQRSHSYDERLLSILQKTPEFTVVSIHFVGKYEVGRLSRVERIVPAGREARKRIDPWLSRPLCSRIAGPVGFDEST